MKSKILSSKITFVIFIALLAVFVTFSTTAAAQTQREYVISMIRDAGMRETMIGAANHERDALARSLGFFNNWNYNPDAIVTAEIRASMDTAMAEAFNGLRDALSRRPMEPYFVNGMAQPIFYYGNNNIIDTSGYGVVRFVVYVETDLDTDGDGQLDLVRTLVQLPRAALDGSKFATIFEARPYTEGTNSQGVHTDHRARGDAFLAANPNFSHYDLHRTATPRVRRGEATLADMVANADRRDWYYEYRHPNNSNSEHQIMTFDTGTENEMRILNWYDYFLVRGFAVVVSHGLAAARGEGVSTCGADVEINGFRAIVQWLAGDARAFTDRVNNIEVRACWSNGNVGMTGRSYGGTTPFGVSTTGVRGLKTIVPVAGIASWYGYTNSQGAMNTAEYTTGLAWHCNPRIAAWNLERIAAGGSWEAVPLYMRYMGYSQLMRREEAAFAGDYSTHWRRRDYTVDGWFRDWGPSRINVPMLIVHGANDNNVRPKQSIMMYKSARRAGVEARIMWHQGAHITPTFELVNFNAVGTPADPRPWGMLCGDYMYCEWLNMWFSHHLYGVENGIMEKFPAVLAQDNATGEWLAYDAWDSQETIVINDTHRVRPAAPDLSPDFQVMGLRTGRVRVFEESRYVCTEVPLLDEPSPLIVYRTPEELNAHLNDVRERSIQRMTRGEGLMPAVFAPDSSENFTIINSVYGAAWTTLLNAPTAGSSLYHFVLPEDTAIKGVVRVNLRAAISSLGATASHNLRIAAKLVEIAAPGTNISFFGDPAMGTDPPRNLIQAGGFWQGGGVGSKNLVELVRRTDGMQREIGRGWMDLTNPRAGFWNYAARHEDSIIASDNIGVFHNYTIYMQPAVHTALAGNTLALIITPSNNTGRSAAVTGGGQFTFTIDNAATNAVIPVALPVVMITAQVAPTVTVTEGDISGELTVIASATMGRTPTFQWYSNTVNSNTGGTAIHGATSASFTIPTDLTEGTYYFYVVVSAPGAASAASNVAAVIVEPEPVGPTPEPDPNGGGGCNVGIAMLVLFAIIPMTLMRRRG